MRQKTPVDSDVSSANFDALESIVRERVQSFIQDILEEELTEFLGRNKWERQGRGESTRGYRNGYGKPRRLSMSSGTIVVRRPRARDLDEKFESRVLPLFVRKTKEVRDLIPELYLHGLSKGDFELALRGLLGEGAPLSASSVARLKVRWQADYEEWKCTRLAMLKPVYVWVDGIYVKAGLEKQKAAVLVVLAALSDGSKRLLTLEAGHRESIRGWADVLRGLRDRGLSCPKLIIGDGHLGIWGALRQVYPDADEQRCWNHRMVNVLDRIPRSQQAEAKEMLRRVMYADSRSEADRYKKTFQKWCANQEVPKAGDLLDIDWDRMVAFFRYPKQHWQHLRTTNPIESPFAAVRLRTNAAKRYKRVDNATAVIWRTLMVAERRFRRLRAPDLLAGVWEGATYVDGIPVITEQNRGVAA